MAHKSKKIKNILGMAVVGRKAMAHQDYAKRKQNKDVFSFKQRVRLAELMYCSKDRDYTDSQIEKVTGLLLSPDLIWKTEVNDFIKINKKDIKKIESLSPIVNPKEINAIYTIILEEIEKNNCKLTDKLKKILGNPFTLADHAMRFFYNELVDKKNSETQITRILEDLKNVLSKEKAYSDILLSPELKLKNFVSNNFLELYPALEDYYIVGFSYWAVNYSGLFSAHRKVILVDTKDSLDEINKTLNHELQHLIQEIEDFDRGANSASILPYQNNVGEWEARKVANRLKDKKNNFFTTKDEYFPNATFYRQKLSRNSYMKPKDAFLPSSEDALWVHSGAGRSKRYRRLQNLNDVSTKSILLDLENFIINEE